MLKSAYTTDPLNASFRVDRIEELDFLLSKAQKENLQLVMRAQKYAPIIFVTKVQKANGVIWIIDDSNRYRIVTTECTFQFQGKRR